MYVLHLLMVKEASYWFDKFLMRFGLASDAVSLFGENCCVCCSVVPQEKKNSI